MKRRPFLKSIGVLASTALLSNNVFAATAAEEYPELAKHKIRNADVLTLDFHWPRLVGRNGTKDVHGQYQKSTILRVRTDQGAEGWGISERKVNDSLSGILGKRVVDVITPTQGLASELDTFHYDFAMFDLMGVILQKPVYQILGGHGPRSVPVYSGMIYIDELPHKESKGGLEIIMQNCESDFDRGYRQLKIKIGRGHQWYSHDEGMKMDIKVFKMIHDEYHKKNVDLLVDANNGYTVEDAIAFLEGIKGLPLYWIEEPFPEQVDDGNKLRTWMDKNGFGKTRYADGEWIRPDAKDIALDMVKQKIVNTYINDIHAYGLTNWMKVMPMLKKANADASPHAWGDLLKTHYTTHLAAGLGNISTIEGVTCLSDDIDYGNYPIKDGKISVSNEPGFGMKLLKAN
jgi:L-alanine-DL-glutamate epimerase-like enolase superfamily enzyme